MSRTATATSPCEDFLAWRAAVDAAAALRAPLIGRRIRTSSPFRDPDSGLTGVIRDVTASGFKVRWDHSLQVSPIHPDDVVFI